MHAPVVTSHLVPGEQWPHASVVIGSYSKLRNEFKLNQIDLIHRELTINAITAITFGINGAVRVSLTLAYWNKFCAIIE
jgi:hypothetical protein